MTLPRFTPIQPQSQPQQEPLPHLAQSTIPPSAAQELAAISSLNANISVASSTLGYAYTASGIAYRCGVVTFTTTANIAAGGNLFTVTLQHPFRGTPIVICGGGPAFTNAFNAISTTPTSFICFNVNIVGTAAGQGMQWIAIGV